MMGRKGGLLLPPPLPSEITPLSSTFRSRAARSF